MRLPRSTAGRLLRTVLVNRERPQKPLSLATLPPSVWIFIGVLLLRLIFLLRLTSSPFLLPTRGDMHFYNDWARRILEGHFTDHLAFYGLPLYAYLLAAIYAVVGSSPFVPGFLQACLDAGTAVLIYRIAGRVFSSDAPESTGTRPFAVIFEKPGPIIGICAAIGWAFFVPAQAYCIILMPASWLVFVFWFVVWQIVRTDVAPGLGRCLVLGLLIGVTAMGIATILFNVPLLAAAIILRPKIAAASSSPGSGRASWKRALPGKLAALAMVFFGLIAGTSPAWLHNRFVAHDPVFLSAHSGVNFWIGNNPSANGYPHFPPGLRAGQTVMLADSITGAETALGRPLKRSEVSAYWSAKAKAYIADNPGSWLRLLWVKIANFWNAFQYDDLSIITSLREEGVILPGLRFGIVAALALPGMILATVRVPASRWILAAVLLHMVSLLSVFVTERYRLAAVPGLLIFAAFGLWEIWRCCLCARYTRALAYLVLLAAATWAVSIRRGNVELWALDPYNSGVHAIETNHLAAAEQKLTLAHAYVPENAEVNFALGNLEVARGKWKAAEKWYQRTLELDAHHEGVLNNLGVLALEEQQWEAAIKFFEAALAIAPQDATSHYLLARATLANGDTRAALSEIEIALRLNPEQPEFKTLRDQIAARVPEGP